MRHRDAIDVHLRRHGLCWLIAIGLAALAAVLLGLPRSAGATVTPTAPRLVSGRVAEFPAGCQGAQRGVTVVLEPLGRSTETSIEDGSFYFADVPPGDYTLRVEACNPFGCWPELPVTVGDGDVSHVLCPQSGSATITPTPTATPQRTGDLGNVTVTGRVYDDALGPVGGGIEGARVSYGGREPGAVETDADGDFGFALFLHDTDLVHIEASATGFATETRVYRALDLYFGEPVEFALQHLSGEIEIQPDAWQSLPCEADATVTITNRSSDEPLIITAILASNSYSQGDYGTGFTSDLSALELPLTLAPGAHVSFPIHYSAAGQDFPSRLSVRVDSTAHNSGFAVPYRGPIAGCGAPTPTPTATPPIAPCAGDCDGDRLVTIAELVHGVALALGRPVAPCAPADLDADGSVAVNELIAAVAAAADGCR